MIASVLKLIFAGERAEIIEEAVREIIPVKQTK